MAARVDETELRANRQQMTSANCKAFMDEMNVVLRSLQDS